MMIISLLRPSNPSFSRASLLGLWQVATEILGARFREGSVCLADRPRELATS